MRHVISVGQADGLRARDDAHLVIGVRPGVLRIGADLGSAGSLEDGKHDGRDVSGVTAVVPGACGAWTRVVATSFVTAVCVDANAGAHVGARQRRWGLRLVARREGVVGVRGVDTARRERVRLAACGDSMYDVAWGAGVTRQSCVRGQAAALLRSGCFFSIILLCFGT